jgi:hypothetical protein
MRRRVLAAAIGIHAGAAVPWWAAMWTMPEVRRMFDPQGALLPFVLADLVLFVGAGLAAAYGIWCGAAWAREMLLAHTGAACYASLYTLTQYCLTGETWLSVVAMTPGPVLLLFACWVLRR